MKRYSPREDEIIIDQLKGVSRNVHWDIMRRCQYISDEYLPHRSADGIKARWFALIGKIQREPMFKPPIRSLDELLLELSDRTRKKIKVRLLPPRQSVAKEEETT